MAASPAWGDLPLLVVGEILLRLPSAADRVHCAAVCRRWKEAAEAARLTYLSEAEAEAMEMAKAWGPLPRVARMAQGALDPSLSDAGAGADAAPPRPWAEILRRLVAHVEGQEAEAVDGEEAGADAAPRRPWAEILRRLGAEVEAVDGEEAKETTLRLAREVVDLLSHAEADEAPTDEAEVEALHMARKLLDRLLSHARPEEVEEDEEQEALRMLRVVLRRLISIAEAKQAAAGSPPWAELPYDVISEILIRLPLLADYSHCSVMCVNWYHASLEYPFVLPQLFMMTTADKPAMLSLVDGTTRMVRGFPDFARSARLVSSFSGSWVAAALDQVRANVLLRFDAMHLIDLPDHFQHQRLPHMLVHAIALNTCPADDVSSSYMAAAIITGDYPIAFWRPGGA
uniref:F-box domain-containing protein n=1 Tax=Oryza barthii TaxID=65489 RepID=A0A0D3HMN8_9ORYZ